LPFNIDSVFIITSNSHHITKSDRETEHLPVYLLFAAVLGPAVVVHFFEPQDIMWAVFGTDAAVDAHDDLLMGWIHNDIPYRAGRDAVFAAGTLVGNEFDPASDPGNQGLIRAGLGTGRVFAGPTDISRQFALHPTAGLDPDSRVLGRERLHNLTGTGKAAGVAGNTLAHAGSG
jgi:hypothetical protein